MDLTNVPYDTSLHSAQVNKNENLEAAEKIKFNKWSGVLHQVKILLSLQKLPVLQP